MAVNILRLTGSGLKDWYVQRLTAVIILAYMMYVIPVLFFCGPWDYPHFLAFFGSEGMRVFSSLTLLSLVFHGWIGLWTVITDYIKPFFLRMLALSCMVVFLLTLLIWGFSLIGGLHSCH